MRGSYSGNTLAFQANADSSILLPRSMFRVISSAVESLPYTQFVGSSILSSPTKSCHYSKDGLCTGLKIRGSWFDTRWWHQCNIKKKFLWIKQRVSHKVLCVHPTCTSGVRLCTEQSVEIFHIDFFLFVHAVFTPR